MLNYEDTIKSLSDNDKHKLVDLIEGLPSDLNRYVKLHLNDDYLNPSLYKGKRRVLHEYSTISKYLGKNDIEYSRNPIGSYYQEEYCKVLKNINDSKLPYELKTILSNIMNAESYDEETLIKLEIYMAEVIQKEVNSSYLNELCMLISDNIMRYKLNVYDFYTRLVLHDSLDVDNYNHMDMLNNLILNYILYKDKTYSNQHDLAIYLYVYYKQLGIQDCITKYNLTNRFLYLLLQNTNEEYISEVVSKIESFVNDKRDITYVMDLLVHPFTNDKENVSNLDITSDSKKIFISNNFIFTSLNDIIDENELDNISNKIRILNAEEITRYLPHNDEFYIHFDLSENEIGHLINLKNCFLMSAYDEVAKDIKYIGKYNDEYYVFFKQRLFPKSIFGISLKPMNDSSSGINRTIVEIKLSKDFYYKYVSNI